MNTDVPYNNSSMTRTYTSSSKRQQPGAIDYFGSTQNSIGLQESNDEVRDKGVAEPFLAKKIRHAPQKGAFSCV